MQNDSHPKTFDGGVEGHAVNSCHIDHVVRHAHEHDQGRSALSSPPKYKAAGIKPGPSDPPVPDVRELNDFVTSASFASRSALDSDTVFCEIYTPGYPPQKKGSFGFYVKDLRSLLNLSALATPTSSGGSVQESIATKQSTDETAASVLSEPPEAWADCETCGGEGAINRTIHVYENGCGFSHPDVEIIPCTDCMGTGGAIVDAASTYCDICGGDCSSANPPVFNCPLAKQESCPESAPRTETAFHFHRFVKGQERAEGVMICKALSLQDAFYAARKLYNYPNNMDLVLAISDSEVAILRDIARTSVALSECHKEIAKLREQLLSHSTGEH